MWGQLLAGSTPVIRTKSERTNAPFRFFLFKMNLLIPVSAYISEAGFKHLCAFVAHLTDTHCRYLATLRNNRAIDRYKMPRSEKLPENDRLNVNGVTYVHRHDCNTDYIL